MIRLSTERLIIRDPLSTDINDWHRLLSDSKTMYYLPDTMTRSLDESRHNLEVAVNETQNPNRTKYFFAIVLLPTVRDRKLTTINDRKK